MLVAPAPAAPGDSVASAEAAAREASDSHLDAVSRLASTTAEREALETSVAQTEERLEALQLVARERSASAYKRAGTALSVSLDVADVGELDRGNALLARIAADDRRTFEELTRTREELESQREQLEERRAREEDETRRLEETADELNAQLAAARAQAAAEAAAAEAAAAEAAEAERAARAPSPSPTSGASTQAGPAPPPPPPPSYAGTPGTHPQHNHPWMACIRHHESSGNYSAYNPAGPYYGAYQFRQDTWNAAANNYGRPDLIGVRPDHASPYDQDDMAWRLYDNGNGAGHWPTSRHCPG